MKGYKVLTWDWRSPVQGGEPLCDGTTWPVVLPKVELDTSPEECAPGWNYCRNLADALRIGGLWPTGYPSHVVLVEAEGGIKRRDKSRAAQITLIRKATDDEVAEGLQALSSSFSVHQGRMVEEQITWRQALARPRRDPFAVEAGLITALEARGLPWSLRQYEDARESWGAWDARGAWGAWGAWDARGAWDAWDARAAWDARGAWDAWDARAAWDTKDAWAAWDAKGALILLYAGLRGWIAGPPERMTVGIRDSYSAGLAAAAPVGPNILGWAMADQS